MHFANKRTTLILGCLTLAALFVMPSTSRGDEWNRATRFTVNQPFEVPRMVLLPNTPYVIRMADTQGSRNVVQILDGTESHLLTMFMAIPSQRSEATDDSLFTFYETQPGSPLPMHEWFYPGRITGLEFLYPKEQADKIARYTQEKVATTQVADLGESGKVAAESVEPAPPQSSVDTSPKADTTEPVAEVSEKPSIPEAVEPVAAEPAPAIEPNTEPVAQAEAQSPEPIAQEPAAPAATTSQGELPRTAGELPLIGLIGLLCLGAGLGLRALSAKS
jgi:hypothetical protein